MRPCPSRRAAIARSGRSREVRRARAGGVLRQRGRHSTRTSQRCSHGVRQSRELGGRGGPSGLERSRPTFGSCSTSACGAPWHAQHLGMQSTSACGAPRHPAAIALPHARRRQPFAVRTRPFPRSGSLALRARRRLAGGDARVKARKRRGRVATIAARTHRTRTARHDAHPRKRPHVPRAASALRVPRTNRLATTGRDARRIAARDAELSAWEAGCDSCVRRPSARKS